MRACLAVTDIEAPERCPECDRAPLVRYRSDPPWCRNCEWNLAQWPPPEDKRHRRRELRDRRRAFAVNRRLLEELEGVEPQPPRRSRAGVVLAGASAALVVFDVALLGGGVYLLVAGNWPAKLIAVLMILVAVECRIRFFSIPAIDEVTRQEVPVLWSVVDRAQSQLGAPPIDQLLITNDFNAACGRSGVRRRVVLKIGLPLWGALSPKARQALLGHELGHLVNGDPTTGFITQPALATFTRLAAIFDPRGLIQSGKPKHQVVGSILAYVIFLPLHRICGWAHLALWRVAAEDRQRAEAYADALSLRWGGTEGASELVQVLVLMEPVQSALRRAAVTSRDPEVWQAEVARAIAANQPRLRVTEQASMRYDVSAYEDHPPPGLRSRLVRSWPYTDPAEPVPVEAMAAADRELARHYASAQRAVVNSPVR